MALYQLQSQYWNELYEFKTHIYFIESLLERAEKIDRTLKIILAIASSASIGAWAIWNEFLWIWAGIIAFSQVITAVNPYLPYKNRMKSYSYLLDNFGKIMMHAEYKWHQIANQYFTEEKINEEIFEIKKKNMKLSTNMS